MSQEFNLIAATAPETSYTAGAGTDLTLVTGDNTPQPAVGIKVWTIEVCIGTARIFYIRNGTTNMAMNDGVALTADQLYTFTFIAHPSYPVSFRFAGDCTVRWFVVGEGRS